MSNNPEIVLRLISKGELDSILDQMAQAIIYRKRIVGYERAKSLKPGDRVRFVQTARPTYLRGLEGTVQGFRNTRVMVMLDFPVGRFSRGPLRCPVAIIEPIPTLRKLKKIEDLDFSKVKVEIEGVLNEDQKDG